MSGLDDVDLLKADPGGMLQQVFSLPQQLARAAEVRAAVQRTCADLAARVAGSEAREALVCGMGGSAIGGDYAATWAAPHAVRVAVWRGYGLPAWQQTMSLQIFSSYSGNTEETLAAFDASQPHAARVCITTGGALAARAHDADVPVVQLPPGLQPRAALGHSLVALLVLLQTSGLVRADVVAELESAAHAVGALGRQLTPQVPEASNLAKRFARAWHERLPFFYVGDACLAPIATRWKGQLNENAKAHAFASTFPEMNHNEIMAWTALPDVRRRAQLVFLHDAHDHPRLRRRMQLTAELLADEVDGVEHWTSAGDGVLEHMLLATHLGDLASVYLAFLNGVDPTPVARIEVLKARLADGS